MDVELAFRWLPLEELTEAKSSPGYRDLILGGAVDRGSSTITLVRGDLTRLTLPFTFFTDVPATVKPDFDDLEVIDFGQTLRLGEYEAEADAILYEVDDDHRRRADELAAWQALSSESLSRLDAWT